MCVCVQVSQGVCNQQEVSIFGEITIPYVDVTCQSHVSHMTTAQSRLSKHPHKRGGTDKQHRSTSAKSAKEDRSAKEGRSAKEDLSAKEGRSAKEDRLVKKDRLV